MKMKEALAVPKQMQARFDEIVGLTDKFCADRLNAEYAELSHRMAAALARKRPSPLVSGQARTWACAIVYALGHINFLSDRSFEPHMPMAELAAGFGVASSTAGNKSAEIRRMLKLGRFSPEYMMRALIDQNPLIWMLRVNGLAMDIRDAPLEAQQEAFARGLIPYIPDER
jgi:Domain of unknown function (DUF6398)